MHPLKLLGINMADEASKTFGGGLRNYLGTLAFILPFVGFEELVRHFVDIEHPSLPWWISAILIAAGYPIYISPALWERLRTSKPSAELPALKYLRDKDTELGSAIRDMVWRSAWGKWYAAQLLVNSGAPASESSILNAASHIVMKRLTGGELEVRGRLPDKMDYEVIPRTYWRSSALHFIEDPMTLWRMLVIPTGGAEISPDGGVRASDPISEKRTAEIIKYDSLIIDAYQFESIWPKREQPADKKRREFLRIARKRGLDKDEIKKLS